MDGHVCSMSRTVEMKEKLFLLLNASFFVYLGSVKL